MVIATNVNGPFLMARAAMPHFLKARKGRIGPSKAALESASMIWAQDLAGTGITVNTLLPGGATLADVADPVACGAVVTLALECFGKLDVLVSNAGRGMKYVSDNFMTEPTRFWEMSAETWQMHCGD